MLAIVGAFMIALAADSSVAWTLFVVVFVAVMVFSLAVAAKRLHDRDKSAWWLVLFYLGPALASGLGDTAGDAGVVFHLVSFGISIWALVELGFLRGSAGPNRFGADPLDTANSQPVGSARSVS